MTNFAPTDEQQAIINFACNETRNLAVIARAGAAKTTTLVLIAEALPKVDILCLAFNKKIALEMEERLPSNCSSKTLHSLGYSAWYAFTRNKPRLDNRKGYRLLKAEIEKLDGEDKTAAYESMADTLNLIATAKGAGYLPARFKGHWKPLQTDGVQFYGAQPMEPSQLQENLVDACLIASFREALEGNIDFDDMVYCPAICSVSWPVHQLYLVDEGQDLSPLNHHVLKKMIRNRRVIVVGDPLQAIYGFRGADTQSLGKLIKMFDMDSLYLTMTFRCARKIVEQARWRAPDMVHPVNAPEGEVRAPVTWDFNDSAPGDAFICRNNAPLFSLAIQMINNGLMPELAGKDLAGPMKKIMSKLGKPPMLRDSALHALGEWEAQELKRARGGAKGSIRDKASCIRLIIEQTRTLGDAIAYLEHLLSRPGRYRLMTGHKAKGLEFDRVWFLDPHICNMDNEQDKNLKYVIETRAKRSLNYIRSDARVGWNEE